MLLNLHNQLSASKTVLTISDVQGLLSDATVLLLQIELKKKIYYI